MGEIFPALAGWAELDPARYPFDAGEAQALIETVDPALWHQDPRSWTDAVSVVLSDRFGPWAYRWYWAPEPLEEWDWITGFPAAAEATSAAAHSLLLWRRWLEKIAERIDHFLPALQRVDAEPGDLAATWEAAIAELARLAVAPISDDDCWQGGCRRALQWLLTASGVPEHHAAVLVHRAVDKRFDTWIRLTSTDVIDIAEQLTRDLFRLSGRTPPISSAGWPDTWPQNWPAWRATNCS